jgi:methyl-accepting chemotaxis protein
MASKTQESPALRTAETRRSLGRLAAMLALVVLSEMLVGLFATWSLDRLNREQHAQARQALAGLDDARSAQVQFKMQVQAWKNLLLRGDAPQDREAWLQSLLQHEAQVQRKLRSLRSNLPEPAPADILATLDTITLDHQQVGGKYRVALESAARQAAWQPTVIDAQVRGIDRPLDLRIDALAERLLEQADQTLAASREATERRFALLKHLMWWSAGLALGLIAILITRALRRPHQEP